MKNRGFGIIETIITIAILSIISYIGYGVYKHNLISSNEKITQHQLVSAMHDFEKYYANNGAYSTSDASYPASISSRLASFNNKYYTFTILPTTVKASLQSSCIEAIPNSGTIQKDSSILVVDNSGNLSANIPISCQSKVAKSSCGANDFPSVCMQCSSMPGDNDPAHCGSATMQTVLDNEGIDEGTDLNVYSSSADGYTCNSAIKRWFACSGNCQGMTVCGNPASTGCSGNCQGAVLYNAPCSGWCNNVVFHLKTGVAKRCSGDCSGTTVVYDQ